MCKIDNTTAVRQVWDRINHKVGGSTSYSFLIIFLQFDVLFAKRAFVHWFVGSGIEDGVVDYARLHTATLEKDYLEIETNTTGYKEGVEYWMRSITRASSLYINKKVIEKYLEGMLREDQRQQEIRGSACICCGLSTFIWRKFLNIDVYFFIIHQ